MQKQFPNISTSFLLYKLCDEPAMKLAIKNYFLLLTAILIPMLVSLPAQAAVYHLQIENPHQEIAYVVGDTFIRTVTLNINTPYQLQLSSLPAKGLQIQGVELRKVQVDEKRSWKMTRYQIKFEYQIFNSWADVKKLAIPKFPLKISNPDFKDKSFIITVPAWQFRVSPLAVNGENYIEQDMSPYRGPMLVESSITKVYLGLFLAITLLACIGLVYINEDKTWFPGMGGPFALSYRKITGIHVGQDIGDIAAIQLAATSIHHAFNQTYGENLFAADIDTFLQKHPGFSSIKQEISHFFNLSNQVLFATKTKDKPGISIASLIQFCEQCRHCERGIA